jgi:hypothetical protein
MATPYAQMKPTGIAPGQPQMQRPPRPMPPVAAPPIATPPPAAAVPPPAAPPPPDKYNPAGRDIALRAMGMGGDRPFVEGGGGVHGSPGGPMQSPGVQAVWDQHPDRDAFRSAMDGAPDDAARMQLIQDYRNQMDQWHGNIRTALAEFHQQRNPNAPGPTTAPTGVMPTNSGYDQAWDQFDQQDQQQAPATEPAPVDEAARAEAVRIKRIRQRRLG